MGVSDPGEGASEEAADCDAQAAGLGNWVHVVHFLRCRTQQEKGGARRKTFWLVVMHAYFKEVWLKIC